VASVDDPSVYVRDPDRSQSSTASLLRTLRRRWWIVILTTAILAGAAAGFAYLTRDTYKSTAQLLFDQTIGPQLNALGLNPPFNNADRLAGDDQAIVGSQQVAELTAGRLGSGTTADWVQNHVSVSGTKTSDVVSVVATEKSPKKAAHLANVYAGAAVEIAQNIQSTRARAVMQDLAGQLAALSPALRRGVTGQQLRNRIATLHAISANGTGTPQIIQPGYVPSHRSGNLPETIGLGVLFGLLLGVALALLREQADRRLRHAEDVSAAFEAPVLATIPRVRALERHVPFGSLPPDVADAFFMLQSNLRYGRHSVPSRSLLITSAKARQGKTTVAWNLAGAAASAGLTVAVIDADLRRSSLAADYGLRSFPGLTEVLRGDVSAFHAVQRVSVPLDNGAENGDSRRVDVLIAGSRPPDPSALIQSPLMADVIDEFRDRYDMVIVDTPPIAHVADAISVLRHVDGVLVVASVHSIKGPEAMRLREQLNSLDARVFGVVANRGSRAESYTPYLSVAARSN
jgi:polysaccharide biosynthesis transport protein